MTEDKAEGAIARPLTEEAADKANEGRAPPRTLDLCEVCGREKTEGPFYASDHLVCGSGEECYRLGYEREKARADAVERQLEEEDLRWCRTVVDHCPHPENTWVCCSECLAAALTSGTGGPPAGPSNPLLSEVKSLRSWRKEAEGLLREASGWVFQWTALAERLRAFLGEGTEGK